MISRLFFSTSVLFLAYTAFIYLESLETLDIEIENDCRACVYCFIINAEKCYLKPFIFKKDFWRVRIILKIKHRIANLQFIFAVISIDIFGLKSFEASPRFNAIWYPHVLQNSYVTDEVFCFLYLANYYHTAET